MTRRQQHLRRALRDVGGVAEGQDPLSEKARQIYGGLCHKLPVLVRTNGLCQTLAFVEEKATGVGNGNHRPNAYARLRQHIAGTIQEADGLENLPPNQLLKLVQNANLADYQRYTRTVLEAWVFYKRLAVSILKVDASQARDEEGTDAG